MLTANTGFSEEARQRPASWQVEALLSLNGTDRKWLARELEVILVTVNRWFSGDRGCTPAQRRKIHDLLKVPMGCPWFPERPVIANGSDQGRFEGKNARASLDAWIREAGYESLHDLELRTQPSPGEWVKVLSPDGKTEELEIDSFGELILAVEALPKEDREAYLRTADLELLDAVNKGE